jgi:hypothetical protein
MKKIVVLCFMIFAQFVFSQTCPDYVDNGEFLRREDCYKYYRKKNEGIIEDVKNQLAKEFNSRLKMQTTASQVYDTCTSKIPTETKSRSNFPQRLIVSWLSQNDWGNFDFRSVDTSLFYTQKDSFECSMKVNLIKLNYPDRLRNKNEPYWENDALIARWKITADSFKACGIKIESLNITTLEFVGSLANRRPILNMNNGMVTNLLEPFEENDQDAHVLSLKYIYGEDWENDKDTAVRGDVDYAFANTYTNRDPSKAFVALKRSVIDIPIKSDKLPRGHLKFAVEAHEGLHVLTGFDAKKAHEPSGSKKFNAVTDDVIMSTGSFSTDQCSDMKEYGKQRGFLRCN